MKYLIFSLFICFYGCKKCSDCTRTWTYENYIIIDSSGDRQYVANNEADYIEPPFENCDVDNPPKTKYETSTLGHNPHGWVYREAKGTCLCVAK